MSASRPLPPPELAGYILGFPQGDLEEYLSMGAFLHEQIVGLAGGEFSWDGKRVLDFGCGSARVLRHFIDQPAGTELHGVALDERCVAWVQTNLSPPLQVARSSPRPPLAFPSEHFDLVWAMSVFSHLSDSWAEWLLELHRVTRPSGRLIISMMGAASSEQIFQGKPRRGVSGGYGAPRRRRPALDPSAPHAPIRSSRPASHRSSWRPDAASAEPRRPSAVHRGSSAAQRNVMRARDHPRRRDVGCRGRLAARRP